MALSVRTVTTATAAGASSITIPVTTQVGDLLLLFAGGYSSQPSDPSGWTLIQSKSGSSSYTDYGKVWYRIAIAGDVGSSVTITNLNGTYSGVLLYVITGFNATAPINTSNGNSGTITVSPGNITTTGPSRRFFFASQMVDNGVVPTFSMPAGNTLQATLPHANNYHRISTWIRNTSESTGTLASETITSSHTGGMVGIVVAVAEVPVPNTPTNLDPNAAFRDPRTQQTFTWTYSHPQALGKASHSVRYRLSGDVTWTTSAVVSTALAQHVFPLGTFTLGRDYEWQVQHTDVNGNASDWSATAVFVAGTSYWTEEAPITSSVPSGALNTAALESSVPYVWQVRTADAGGFGPWSSTSAQLTVGPLVTDVTGLTDTLSYTVSRAHTQTLGGVALTTELDDPILDEFDVPLFVADYEPIGITDSITAVVFQDHARTINGLLGVKDTNIRASTTSRTVATEFLGLTEVASDVNTSDRTILELSNITDSNSRLSSIIRTVLEPVGLQDTVATTLSRPVQTDLLGLTDTVLDTSISSRIAADNFGLTDDIAARDLATVIFIMQQIGVLV